MNGLERLVKEKACTMYSNAARAVSDAAIAECAKMGLSHSAAKELLQFIVAADPKVPESAQIHLMSRIVSAIEFAVESDKEKAEKLKSVISGGDKLGGAGGVDVGAAVADGAKSEIEQIQKSQLAGMNVGEVREKAASLGIETVTPEGKNVARKDLELAILAKQQ